MNWLEGGEGPSVVVGAVVVELRLIHELHTRLVELSLLVLLGVPLTHSVFSVVAAALLAVRLGGEKMGFSPGRRRMVLLPPIMLRSVAALLWPGAGLLHVADVCAGLMPRPCDQQ